MKRIIILLAATALGGCSLGQGLIIARPAAIADQTKIDEQAVLAVEFSYQTAAQLVLTASRAGLIKGETAKTIAANDAEAYRKVQAARAAYYAGNAQNYKTAIENAKKAISLIVVQAGVN